MDGSTKTALKNMEDIATKHCAEIQIGAASAMTKVGIADISTYGKLRYKGKLISSAIPELRNIEKTFHRFHTNESNDTDNELSL
jgi:hypothetical protein